MAVRRTGLARARKAAGYTQETFAEALNVERSTVVRWEAGAREPLPYQRPKLARLLKVGMAELDELLRTDMLDAGTRLHGSGMNPAVGEPAGQDRQRPPGDPPTPAVAMRMVIGFHTIAEAFKVADRKVGGGLLYGQAAPDTGLSPGHDRAERPTRCQCSLLAVPPGRADG
ncbi:MULTISPECIES: helix-turn-helix transcriptional regulator [Saccharothrix]|uniref:helix-turn-helix transcriptional regulator n=1 Tax=Saccharothrix TaxID=2071 RepID=UPI0009F8355D|nr:helix-turn-helix transcriptional regulator [Saccharothrix sp. CB00851]